MYTCSYGHLQIQVTFLQPKGDLISEVLLCVHVSAPVHRAFSGLQVSAGTEQHKHRPGGGRGALARSSPPQRHHQGAPEVSGNLEAAVVVSHLSPGLSNYSNNY